MALFGVGGLVALGMFYSFLVQSRRHLDILQISWRLAYETALLHRICDRPSLHDPDRDSIGYAVSWIDGTLQALERGGQVDGRVLAPASGEERERARVALAAWAAARPGLMQLAASPRGDPMTVPANTPRMHPEVPAFEREAESLVRSRQARLTAAEQRTLYVLIAVCALNLTLFIVGVWRFKGRIQDPARALQEGAQAIREGRYGHTVPVVHDDELGRLTESFNAMSAQLEELIAAREADSRRIGEALKGLEREVAERRAAEERRRLSEARLQRAQQMAHLGNWEVDLNTRSMHWSEEVFRIYGIDPVAELPDERFWDTVHPEDVAAVRAASTSAIATGEAYDIEHRIVRPDGSVRHLREHAEIVLDAGGRAVRMVGAVQDITDFKRMEEQLRHSQKMEAVGRLAGGVAHDFNNLLTVILGFTRLALESLPKGREVEGYLNSVLAAGQRAALVTAQLLAFSRKQMLQLRVVDLHALVADLEGLVKKLIGEDVQLAVDLKASSSQVKVDPSQIEQVLLNLAANARDAMPEGGRLLIETSNTWLDQESTAQREGVAPGPYLLIAVSDNGVGMDAETQRHVFDPFFTTKELGKGTGLGLATVYGILKQSGGDVTVYSEPGMGSTFRLYLPLAAEPAEETPVPHLQPSGGSETVLVIEDERPVRALVTQILRGAGYHVLEADGGQEALDLAAGYPGAIDLLITDVVMPGSRGPEIARRLARFRESLRILYMSGYSEGAVVNRGVLEDGAAFLSKPFTAAVLLHAVRKSLDATLVAPR